MGTLLAPYWSLRFGFSTVAQRVENLYGFLDLTGDSGSGVGRSWPDLLVDIDGAMVSGEGGGGGLGLTPENCGAPAADTVGRGRTKAKSVRRFGRVFLRRGLGSAEDERLNPSVTIIAHRSKWPHGAPSVSPFIPQEIR
jgi:hypothetical protein